MMASTSGTHSVSCAKAQDHARICNCGLTSAKSDTEVALNPNLERGELRCNAWFYPGHFTWDIQLHSKPGGHRCALNANHHGPHELAGPWAASQEHIDHPNHYGGKDNIYEAIKVIAAWKLGFLLGNAVKYISRAGKKDPAKLVEDLKKSRWYLDDAIARLERGGEIF